ncbi:MAG TPA: DUF2335 domain-containing protein [Thermoanaerobaculia bacterium]|nr:DUF2335 domain-containing protein [Thermoanaerobaculia bacterium]
MGRKDRGNRDRRRLAGSKADLAGAQDFRSQSPQYVARVEGTVFQGPLPPPEILVRYNDAVPDGAERIIKMAERNQEHRQRLEGAVVPSRAKSELRGQIFGFIIAMAAIGCGTYLIAIDKDTQGLAIVIADIIALVGLFLYVDHRKRRDLAAKRE